MRMRLPEIDFSAPESVMNIVRWRAEAATYLLLLLGFAFLYWQTFSFAPSVVRGYPGAAFFPRLILYVAFAATAVALFLTAAARRGDDGDLRFDLANFATTIAVIGAFIIAMPLIGFEISSLVLMFALLGPRMQSWTKAAALSVATLAVNYILFVVLLRVALPLQFLPLYLNF